MISPTTEYLVEHNTHARTPIHRVTMHRISVTKYSAYWKLDEVSGGRIDSIGANALTQTNTVGSAAGKISLAAQFTATNEYLSCPVASGNVLQLGNVSFTVFAWVYLDASGTSQTIASQWETAGNVRSWRLRYGVNRFEFFVSADGSTEEVVGAIGLGAPVTSTWYFVVAWFDSDEGTINIQVNNGVVDSASTSLYAMSSTVPFRIGSIFIAGAAAELFDGRIDEVGFINGTALTSGERIRLYGAGDGLDLSDASGNPVYVCTRNPRSREPLGDEILQPVVLDRRVEVENCRFPLSSFSFLLHDIDNRATEIVSEGIIGRHCELHETFWELGSASLVQLFGGIITEVENLFGSYRVTARSLMAAAQNHVIFSGAKTQLTAAINSSDTSIPVVSTLDFGAVPSDTLWGDGSGLAAIDNEILITTAKTSGTLTATRVSGNYAVPPPLPGSTAAAHGINAAVREMIHLGKLTATNSDSGTNDLHPIDLLRVVLTNSNPKFAIGNAGLTLNDDELDTARTALGAGLKFRFIGTEAVNAKKFIEEEIYLPCAMYPTEDEQGRVGAKLFQGSADCDCVDSMTDDHVTEHPRWLRNGEKLINMVVYNYDYNPITKDFMSTFTHRDEAKILEHGRELPLVINSKGIRSAYTSATPLTWFADTAAFLTDAAERHIERFGGTSPVISVSAMPRKSLLEISDDIEATFSQVVSMSAGARGITDAPMEVTALRYDFDDDLIELELLGYPE